MSFRPFVLTAVVREFALAKGLACSATWRSSARARKSKRKGFGISVFCRLRLDETAKKRSNARPLSLCRCAVRP